MAIQHLFACQFQYSNIPNLEIEVNSQPYNGATQICAYDSLYIFPYYNLPGFGLFGPYSVNEWIINGDTVSGTFNNVAELADLMSSWDAFGNWTTTTDINGNIVIVGGDQNSDYGTLIIEQIPSSTIVNFNVGVQFLPSRFAIALPSGSSSLVITNTLTACSDTVSVEVYCVETDTIQLTIMVDSTDIYCLELDELQGNLLSVENICPDQSGEDVQFEIIGDCVNYSGLDPGADTACIVICDDFGICDTTILFITAEINTSDTTFVAVNDTIVGGEDQVILINVFQNDVFMTLNDFNIIDMPMHGQAAFLPNGEINYVPEDGYCDDENPDSFTYEICNANGCDTATVFITVQCGGLEIFNAMSPNYDGKNDFFKINGLQNWPNHHLYIYNRWGNLVYEATNYQSDWYGTWNGKDLPDGTYFYVLDLGIGEKPKDGYVQISR